jgi:ubiquinol-cytochrome c reductase cytochrome c subunit
MRRTLCIALLGALGICAAAGAAPPKPGTPAARGDHLYGRYCLSCHGANGGGRAQAPSLRGVGALAADFYLRTGYMPLPRLGLQPRRRRVLFDERQLDDLTAYVASLGTGPAIPTPQPARGNLSEGLHLFTDHCAGCHQVVAEGGYVTGGVPPPLEDDDARQIAEAVRIGPYVMPRFTKKAISDRQLDSIVAYVQYAKHPDDRGGWAIGHLGPVPEGLVTWFLAAATLVAVCLLLGRRLRHG